MQRCLDSVPLEFTRRAARKCDRYMDAYRKGATGRLADFANKKYNGHRCLPESWFDDLKAEYLQKFGEQAEESMIKVAEIDAPRPELGEFGVEEEEGAEEGEEQASASEEESDHEGAAETDESEGESSDSDEAAAQENEVRKEKQVRAATASFAAIEAREAARGGDGEEDAHGRSKRQRGAVNYALDNTRAVNR